MKQLSGKIFFSLIAVFVLMLLVGSGCTNNKDKEVSTDGEVETGSEYWSSNTDKGEIGGEAIAGKINDKEETIENVKITQWEDEYTWTFSDLAPDDVCGVIIENDAVNFSSKDLEEGTFKKKMDEEIEFDDYHAYYHYNQEDGTPMSVNVGWSADIVVTNIDKDGKKAEGYAKFEFNDGKTAIEGKFVADLCE
jgi:hypothetical protein